MVSMFWRKWLLILAVTGLFIAPTAMAQTSPQLQLLPIGRLLLADAIAKKAAFPMPMCGFAGGLCGAVNRDDSIAVAPEYDWVDEFAEDRALVRRAGLYGYVDPTGRVIVEPKYALAGRFADGYAQFDVSGRMGLLGRDGRIVIEPRYGYIQPKPFGDDKFITSAGRDLFEVARGATFNFRGSVSVYPDTGSKLKIDNNSDIAAFGAMAIVNSSSNWTLPISGIVRLKDNPNKLWVGTVSGWGLLSATGAWEIAPKFEQIKDIGGGLYSFAASKLWGVVDGAGKIVVAPQFEAIATLQNGSITVARNGLWGYIDITGKIAIEPKFEAPLYFSGDYAPAALNKKYGLIDRTGQWVLQPTYHSLSRTYKVGAEKSQWWDIRQDNKHGLLDESGKLILEPIFTQSVTICENRLIGFVYNKVKIFDLSGKSLMPDAADGIYPSFCSNFYNFATQGKFGVADVNLKVIAPAIFESARGLTVKLDGKIGLLKPDGTWALKPVHEGLTDLGDGTALVKQDGHASLIRMADESIVIQPRPGELCRVPFGLSGVLMSRHNDKSAFIDTAGNTLFEPVFHRIGLRLSDGLLPVMRNEGEKWGFADVSGKLIIDAQYDEHAFYDRGVAWVRTGNTVCPIDRRGKPVQTLACKEQPPVPQPARFQCKVGN
jgi:hypothetical protein